MKNGTEWRNIEDSVGRLNYDDFSYLYIDESELLQMYLLFNVICLVFQFSKVSGMSRETYSDLKQSASKEKSLIKVYYLYWQHLKKEAECAVSFIKYR